jgi:hypothetical protein
MAGQIPENPTSDPRESLPGLAENVKRVCAEPAWIPMSTDAAMRKAIRLHFAQQRDRRGTPVRAARRAALAAAAVIAVAATLFMVTNRSAPPTTRAAAGPADIDRNGRVDILDAYALARFVETKSASNMALDLNGDGAVDRLDVDIVALRAVALTGGTSS